MWRRKTSTGLSLTTLNSKLRTGLHHPLTMYHRRTINRSTRWGHDLLRSETLLERSLGKDLTLRSSQNPIYSRRRVEIQDQAPTSRRVPLERIHDLKIAHNYLLLGRELDRGMTFLRTRPDQMRTANCTRSHLNNELTEMMATPSRRLARREELPQVAS